MTVNFLNDRTNNGYDSMKTNNIELNLFYTLVNVICAIKNVF
jgi:hypothetical protein